MSQSLEQIMRKYHPDIDEIYRTLEALEHQCAALRYAEAQPSSGFHEVVAKKRMDELIRIQLDDLQWKQSHPSTYDFMQRHPRLRLLWFGQIMTPEEADQVKQEVELILEMPLFAGYGNSQQE